MLGLSQHEVIFNWYLDSGGKILQEKSYFLFLWKQISSHEITVEVELSQWPRRVLFTLLELLFIKKMRVAVGSVDIARELSNDSEIGIFWENNCAQAVGGLC